MDAGPSAAQPVPAVEVCDASVRLGGRTIWSELSMRMQEGEFVALLGANGSGKSTLLRVLLGALPLSAGSARVLGRPPGAARREIGYLPQRRAFDAGLRLRGRDIVALGLDGDRWGLPLPRGRTAARRARRVEEALDLVGARSYAGRAIGECSGGEQQRLLIAQALVREPRLLLLDEPLDSLDLANQTSVAALLGRISSEQGVGVLLVAHDVNPLLAHLDRVVYLGDGHAIAGRVEDVITSETLTRLHGVPVEVLRASDGRLVVVGQPEPPAHHADRHADSAAPGHVHAG